MADNQEELQLLKDRATIMGIVFHPAIGVAKLKEKINNKLQTEPTQLKAEPVIVRAPKPAKSAAQILAEKNVQLRKMANRLTRIRVTCMNPNKKDWPGEIFSVSNRVIGTIKKFVPFNAEAGYHVPEAILILMRERQFQAFKVIKLPNGSKQKKGFLTKEFAIEILDPLTLQELKDLANQQAMGNKIDQ